MEVKERQFKRMEYLLAFAGFLLIGFLVNRGISTSGYCLDDLYLWYCYDKEPFWQYLFPLGGSKFRVIFNIFSYLELWLLGDHLEYTVAFNIVLNCIVALTIFWGLDKITKQPVFGFLAGGAYMLSHFSYYQISQAYGLMETLALWGAIAVFYLLYQYLQKEDGTKEYLAAAAMYILTCLVHERFMVLTGVLVAAVFLKKIYQGKTRYSLLLAAVGSFFIVSLIRFLAMGSLTPAGTGGTDVIETFSISKALGFAISNVFYVFGIHAGPVHLNGIEWYWVPFPVKMCVYAADGAIVLLLILTAASIWRQKERRKEYLCVIAMTLVFLAMCIGAASSTIRLELRWVYVSYVGALFLLGYFLFILKREGKKVLVRAGWVLAALYFVLIIPTELCYRSNFKNLYYWHSQLRANSLADVTYGTYKDKIFNSEIKIIGNFFDLDDYIIDTFWKPYRKDETQATPKVTFINSIEEAGFITDRDNVYVLAEDKTLNRYIDLTPLLKLEKFRTVYGFYADGWMDQEAEVDVFTGTSGEIRFDCYFPEELKGGETITISSEGEILAQVTLEDQWPIITIPAPKEQYVNLHFSMNFALENPAEAQRGETPMCINVIITAE